MTISRGTDTFTLNNGGSLDLTATATANDTVNVIAPFNVFVQATFNLIDHGGHVAINLAAGASNVTGNMQVRGGSVVMNGGGHNYWIPTGVNRISAGADVKLNAQMIGAGVFEVSGGARLEFLCWPTLNTTTLSGGKVDYWDGWAFGGAVTFAKAAGSEFDVHTALPVSSYTMDAKDLLTLFDASGGVQGSVTVHDHTAQHIQVDRTSFGVAIFADNTPHPGMIPIGVA